jgi:hypothetical protein
VALDVEVIVDVLLLVAKAVVDDPRSLVAVADDCVEVLVPFIEADDRVVSPVLVAGIDVFVALRDDVMV